ncbi:hypothetical protein JTB14_026077 [Gonioctena quinquepunctata]|nr:hypothetical protein JTB14_026077 [Gonioctena quinquepunctata]
MATWKDNMPREKPRLYEECTPQTQCRVLGHCPVRINSDDDATRQITSSIDQGRMSVSRDTDGQPCATSKRKRVKAQDDNNKEMIQSTSFLLNNKETESKTAGKSLEGRSQGSTSRGTKKGRERKQGGENSPEHLEDGILMDTGSSLHEAESPGEKAALLKSVSEKWPPEPQKSSNR